MARRVTKRPMGLQDNNTDPNKRNTFQPNLWHISSHSSRSRCNQPQEGVLRRTKQRRAAKTKSRLFIRSQRTSLPKNDQVPAEDSRILQSEGKAEKVQHWRSRPSKSGSCNKGPSTGKVRTNLGRTIQGRPLFSPRKLPLGGSS